MTAEELMAQVVAYKKNLYEKGESPTYEVSRMHLAYSCYLLNVMSLEHSSDILAKDMVFTGGKLTPWIDNTEPWTLSSYNTNYFMKPYYDDSGTLHYTDPPSYDVMAVPSYFTAICDYIFSLNNIELSELWERDPMYQKLPLHTSGYVAPLITYFDMKRSLRALKWEGIL